MQRHAHILVYPHGWPDSGEPAQMLVGPEQTADEVERDFNNLVQNRTSEDWQLAELYMSEMPRCPWRVEQLNLPKEPPKLKTSPGVAPEVEADEPARKKAKRHR